MFSQVRSYIYTPCTYNRVLLHTSDMYKSALRRQLKKKRRTEEDEDEQVEFSQTF